MLNVKKKKKKRPSSEGKNILQPIIKKPKSERAQAQFISSVQVTFKYPGRLIALFSHLVMKKVVG